MELSEQEVIRRHSLEELRGLGINPYPAAEFVTNAFSTEIKEKWTDPVFPEGATDEEKAAQLERERWQVSIAGRMMSRRVMGKASFMELQPASRIKHSNRADTAASTLKILMLTDNLFLS